MGKQFDPPGYHVVEQGDWMSKIAKWYGFPKWETIWNDAKNAQIKQLRGNGNLLLVGDKVYIPGLEVKPESKSTNSTHKFKVTRQKVSLSLRLLDHKGKPRKSMPYKLTIPLGEKEVVLEGQTDGAGQLTEDISASATVAYLVIDGLPDHTRRLLLIGELDPVETPTGALARLHNLGYDPKRLYDEDNLQDFSADMKSALRAFDLREIKKDERTHTDELSFDKDKKLRKLHENE